MAAKTRQLPWTELMEIALVSAVLSKTNTKLRWKAVNMEFFNLPIMSAHKDEHFVPDPDNTRRVKDHYSAIPEIQGIRQSVQERW